LSDDDDDDDEDDVDDDVDDAGGRQVAVHGAVSLCRNVGQLLVFALFSCTAPAPVPTVLGLVLVLPAAVLGYLAAEIRLRLQGGSSWSGGAAARRRRRRGYVAVRMDDDVGTTWLPQYDPVESPRKDRVRPLYDEHTSIRASPRYATLATY